MNKKNLKDTIGKIGRVFRRNGIVFRHFVFLLAVIVVFTTTYSLILPALTIDSRTADATPGIELEKDGEGSSGEEEVPDGEVEKADEDNQSSEPAAQSGSSQESKKAKSSGKSKKSKKQPVVEDFFEAETVPAVETETEKHIKVEEAVSEKEPEEKMAELADNAKRLRAFREAGPEMSAREKEDLRQEMLHGCSKIQELGAKIKSLTEPELTAMSKMYAPHNRETAVQMNLLGARGLDTTVLKPVSEINKVLAANVPSDRITAYLSAYQVLENVKDNTEKNPGMLSLLPDGGAAYKEKMNGLLAQLGTDLSRMTPREKQQHFKTLAEGMTEFLRMGEECTKHFPYLPKGHEEKQRSEDLKKAMTRWLPKPEFIVGALKNGDHYDFENKPAALPAAPAPQKAQNDEPEVKDPANEQELIARISDRMEMLSSIYQHLHEEGHSYGVDSDEYKRFRNAVKAIHNAWNPPETRTIDLSTKPGRDRARQMLTVALQTANVYYHKHAGRNNISSTYGNVRKNAALTTIDVLAPRVMKEYIARGMETGMNMTRNGVIIKQKIGMEELVRNEKAFAALKYANKNSRTYQQTAEKTHQAYQRKEEREAREQNRQAAQIRKEDAVNTFLGRRNHR